MYKQPGKPWLFFLTKPFIMRKICFYSLLLILFCSTAQSQYLELVVRDRATEEPIPYVSVFNEKRQEGTISNAEGKIKLLISADTLLVSHVAYRNIKVNAQENSTKSTLYLEPKPLLLEEVIIYDIDLKKIINKILKKYHIIYLSGSQTYYGTYKETYKVNRELERLSQFKIRFWHKDYMMNFRKPFEKQYQISIDSVDYSKRKKDKLISGGSIILGDLFKSIHLNHFIVLMLYSATDITIDSISKKDDITEIAFKSPIEEKNKYIGNISGMITFDKQLTKILKLAYTYTSSDDFVQKGFTRKDSIPFVVKNQSIYRHISFAERKGKLVLSYFNHIVDIDVKYKNDIIGSSVNSTVDLFVSKIEKGKKTKNHMVVPLNKPLHENLPELKKSVPNIVLSKEELNFINERK